jgi:hypothetical protein
MARPLCIYFVHSDGFFGEKTMFKVFRVAMALLFGLWLWQPTGYAQTISPQTDLPIAQRRALHLRRGINLSEWFAQVYDSRGYTKEHFEAWTTAQDILLIKQMGFDHVRLSVNPAPMFKHNHADELPAEYLGYLDAAVKMILDEGLAIIIDAHPEEDFKEKLGNGSGAVEEFTDFWRALAAHYATQNPDMVFFAVLNEPEMRDASRRRFAKARRSIPLLLRARTGRMTMICWRWSRCAMPTSSTIFIFTSRTFSPIRARPGATTIGTR